MGRGRLDDRIRISVKEKVELRKNINTARRQAMLHGIYVEENIYLKDDVKMDTKSLKRKLKEI